MTAKDAWLLRAIEQGALVVLRDGRVYRKHELANGQSKLTLLSPATHKRTGRVYMNITFEGVTKSCLVNRIVGLAYLSNPHDLPEVNHIDGNKANNAVENLEWAGRSAQEKHAQRTGLKSGRGSQNSMARLTAADVLRIRQNPATSDKEFAKLLNVSASTVRAARSGQTWKHL